MLWIQYALDYYESNTYLGMVDGLPQFTDSRAHKSHLAHAISEGEIGNLRNFLLLNNAIQFRDSELNTLIHYAVTERRYPLRHATQ
jgi:hypothetical protein